MMIQVPTSYAPLPGQLSMGLRGAGRGGGWSGGLGYLGADDTGDDGGGGTDWADVIGKIAVAGAQVAQTALAPAPGSCLLRNANGSCAVMGTGTTVSSTVTGSPTLAQTAAISSSSMVLIGVAVIGLFLIMQSKKG